MRLKISQQGLLLVSIPLLFELVFVSTLAVLHQQAEDATARESHSKNIVLRVNDIMRLAYETGSALLLFALTQSEVAGDRYERLSARIPLELNNLQKLLADNPQGVEFLQQMRAEANIDLALARQIKDSYKQKNFSSAINIALLKLQANQSSRAFMQYAAKIVDLENGLLRSYPEQESRARLLLKISLFVGVTINILMSIVLSIYFSKNITKRLNNVVLNTNLLKHSQPLQPVLGGKDEIAHLDIAFHEMAAALKEAFRKERAVMDNATDIICSLDSDYRFTKINLASTRIWGYDPATLLNESLTDLLARDEVDKVVKILASLKSQAKNCMAAPELRIVLKNNKELWMLWSIHWSPEEQSFFCVAHDINEHKLLEQLKQDFTNMITHDLKTPIMSTRAFLDMLTAGVYGQLSERGVSNIKKIKGSLSRLVDLLQQLLEIEKLQSGRVELELEKTTVASVVDNAIAMVEALAQQQNVRFAVSGDENVSIVADKARLIQVVQNLLSNAIKFSPPNSQITVAWHTANGTVGVGVTDQGPGIPEEQKSIAFDRFQQLAQPDGADPKGTGLGLAICKAIVEEHKGSIGMDSKLGKGTTVWFQLPLS